MTKTTTAAGNTFQLLHQNDTMCSDLILAIRQDDEDGVQDALDAEDLIMDDINLSDDEMKNMLRGFTPSGSLDIALWEGYYVSDRLPNGDKYALLVVAIDNAVYWGPEDKMMDNFPSHAVEYELPTDGTLRLSSSAGAVSLLFSRDYDAEKGTVGLGSFKGTVGTYQASGAHALPPWPKSPPEQRNVRVTRAAARSGTLAVSFNETDDGQGGLPNWVVNWDQTYGGRQILAISTLVGGIIVFRGVCRWIYKRCREQLTDGDAAELTEVLTSQQALALAMATKVNIPDVDWSADKDQRDDALEQTLNDVLRDQGVDVGSDNPDGVVESLRDSTHDALRVALESSAANQVESSVLQQTDSFKIFPDHAKIAKAISQGAVKDRVAEKLASFGYENNASVFDPLTSSVFYDARRVHFHNSYTEAERALPQAQLDAQQATSTRQATEQALRSLDQKIDEEKNDPNEQDALLQDEARKSQLETELEGQKEAEAEKAGDVEKLKDHVEHDPGEADESDRRSREEREKWKETAEGHGI